MRRVAALLAHHPVLDRQAEVVTTAITNLDLHDIARSSRTYGLAGYFVVSPITAQRELAARITGHWTEGEGREHNASRSDALELVRTVESLGAAIDAIAAERGHRPFVVATAAAGSRPVIDFDRFIAARAADPERSLLIVFGTGWGLADEVFHSVDATLEPLKGPTDYNHLSVRGASAIVLDRFFRQAP